MIKFEVGKKYKGEFGTYEIINRSRLFVTLQNGCRYKVVESLGNQESIAFKKSVNYYGATFKETECIFASNEVSD